MPRLPWAVLAFHRRHPATDLALLACLTFPIWRLLVAAGFLGGHDGFFHLFRLVELDNAVRAGVPYPRLAADLALGYDYPVFNYYPPLAAYLSELFKLAGMGYFDAAKPVLALSVVGSAWSMWLFARPELGRAGALIAALGYAYLPYLLVDVFLRAAHAEALALSLLPLCLFAFGRLAKRYSAVNLGLASVTLALLLVAHNITALIFAPLLAAWTMVVLLRASSGQPAGMVQRLFGVTGGAILAFGLSAFYWVPALFERDFVQGEKLLAGFFDFRNHLLSQADQWMHPRFYPSILWLPGEEIGDEYNLDIPPELPPGRYELAVGRYRRDNLARLPLEGGGDRLVLGAVKVVAKAAAIAEQLSRMHPLDADLGGVMLLGYGTGRAGPQGNVARVHPGASLELRLFWQASHPMEAEYNVFIHVYDGQGRLLAQTDGPPVTGNYPTTLWEKGEVVADEHRLRLPADMPAGRYRLVAGLYQLGDGARLKQASGQDSVALGEVVVER